jgi:hypothetical protein
MIGSTRYFPITYSLVFLGPSLLQTLVTLALLVDTLSIVADYICVYLVSVHLLCLITRDFMTI